ncbi:RagB/SusD family protein [Segetibacter sp. 3557_3]|uniref:RagB/SusD family protein n=1 Tax=Segetibacter sp. 3557_3 TaxID=2547429 RepID=UPI00105871A7|nr:RagB/SusD family protein [Segetibacter sp. 3557_3]TDH26585.1 RagB/SusD family protein [Segetibacter sp. 3557_3]
MKKLNIKKLIVATLMFAGLVSCKKQFDLKPGIDLDASQMYRNVYDANGAVIGIYGKFMALADRYVILNELRGDLLQYTQNADEYLRQVSTHSVSADNPYANPRPFYELIINCNDVLKNFNIMRQKNALNELDYNQRYSDIACLRSFLYLQLGIHYGQVPYVTDALETVTDANDISRFPRLTFDVLLDSLINFTDKIPFKEVYPPDPTTTTTSTSLNYTLDAYQTQRFFINKKVLLGDLHLWKGNYRKAATYYREVMEIATVGTQGENYYAQYKLGWSGNANLYVSYSRAGDASTLLYADGWRTMFEASDDRFSREWIWALPYDSKFSPQNPLIRLFSPIGGDYLVKPSQSILDNWNSQQQVPVAVAGGLTGIPYDARGLLSVRDIGGQKVAMKYLYNYISHATNAPVNPLAKNGKWFLFRQTHLHLRFAEAANREGFHKLTYAFLNNGVPGTFAPPPPPVTVPVTPAITDMTNWMNTLSYPAPYNFDARFGEIPRYRSDWYRHIGIRRRANVTDFVVPAGADSLIQLENGLINEGALENAFEGTRWADLLRIALRRNDPAFLADKIYDKLRKDNVGDASAVRAKLMNKENWYLPFKLQ